MSETSQLRPIERRILRLLNEGVPTEEIARRFRRSPAYVSRVIDLTRVPRRGPGRHEGGLRPIERRVLAWRERGSDHGDIARRFRRSPAHVARIEELARYKLRAS